MRPTASSASSVLRNQRRCLNVKRADRIHSDTRSTLFSAMLFPSNFHSLRRVATFAAVAGLSFLAPALSGSEAEKMAPFLVESEFGVDALRFQNSVSVLNQHLLDEHGVVQLQDISGIAPNLFASNSDSRGFGDILALRGVANTLFFSQPGVVLYVDGVPGGSVSSYPSGLPAVESLIVRAGSQATEFGRNAPGGVIELRTRAPGTVHRGSFAVDRGSYDFNGFQAAVDGPITDRIGYSATIGYTERDGYIENTFQKRPADDRSSLIARGSLHVKATDSLQLRFGFMGEKVRDDAPRLTSLFSPDPFVVSSDVAGLTTIDRLQFSFQARKTFGWGLLTATTSRQEWELAPALTDLDLSPYPLGWSRVDQTEKLWTQEVRLESSPGAEKTRWRAGAFFFDSTVDSDGKREFMVPPGPQVPPGFVQTERTLYTNDQTSVAAYGSIEHALSEKLTGQFGVRIERSDTGLDRGKSSSNNFGFPVPPDSPLQRSQSENYLSLRSGLSHSVSESLNVLGAISLAHQPAGYSGFTANPALARFSSGRIWSGEFGVTFSPPKGRFGASLLGFWNLMDRYQFERTVPNSTDFVVVNADEVTSRGIEAKFMWNPVKRVWWDFQAGYTRAEFEDHRDSSGRRVDGNRVPYIPEYTLRTGLTFELAKGLTANASYAAVGRTYYDERNTTMFSQPTYGLVNAQIKYRFERWTTTVYGFNLADKNHYQFVNPEIAAGSPGAPRRFGVQVAWSY